MSARNIAEELGIELDFDALEKKGEPFLLHQVKRKVRYFCFRMKTKTTNGSDEYVPEKLVSFFENHEGFEGWQNFSKTWDVKADDPRVIWYRDFSINEEWDATIRRVVPELPIDRKLRQHGPEGNI